MMGLVKGPETERSVLVTKKTNQSADQKGQKHRKRPYCDYCHKKGHTQNSCWRLHGKPADWKPKH